MKKYLILMLLGVNFITVNTSEAKANLTLILKNNSSVTNLSYDNSLAKHTWPDSTFIPTKGTVAPGQSVTFKTFMDWPIVDENLQDYVEFKLSLLDFRYLDLIGERINQGFYDRYLFNLYNPYEKLTSQCESIRKFNYDDPDISYTIVANFYDDYTKDNLECSVSQAN